jgi:serine/threonine protein kinase
MISGGDIENLVEFKSSVDLWYSVDCYDNDKSWDNIIQNIIAMQSQVQNLKSRYDKVIREIEPSYGIVHSDLKPENIVIKFIIKKKLLHRYSK